MEDLQCPENAESKAEAHEETPQEPRGGVIGTGGSRRTRGATHRASELVHGWEAHALNARGALIFEPGVDRPKRPARSGGVGSSEPERQVDRVAERETVEDLVLVRAAGARGRGG